MDIQSLVTFVAGKLRADEFFNGIPVLEVDTGNVDRELEASVAKRNMAVLVGWDGFKSTAPASMTIFGETSIVVSVFEQPIVNRARPGAKTTLEAAREIAAALNLVASEDGLAPLSFSEITPVVALTGGDNGVITCDVRFRSETTL